MNWPILIKLRIFCIPLANVMFILQFLIHCDILLWHLGATFTCTDVLVPTCTDVSVLTFTDVSALTHAVFYDTCFNRRRLRNLYIKLDQNALKLLVKNPSNWFPFFSCTRGGRVFYRSCQINVHLKNSLWNFCPSCKESERPISILPPTSRGI